MKYYLSNSVIACRLPIRIRANDTDLNVFVFTKDIWFIGFGVAFHNAAPVIGLNLKLQILLHRKILVTQMSCIFNGRCSMQDKIQNNVSFSRSGRVKLRTVICGNFRCIDVGFGRTKPFDLLNLKGSVIPDERNGQRFAHVVRDFHGFNHAFPLSFIMANWLFVWRYKSIRLSAFGL